MQKNKKVLITNDDGIHSPGLEHLWKALVDIAEVYIIAPATEKSATSLGLTVYDPIQIKKIYWDKNTPAWQVSGTPADCVRLGISVILDHTPDLIVSGINKGANSGRTTMYSGTVGGVIEGALRNIPGIAFSCSNFSHPNYQITEKYVRTIVKHVLEHPLSTGTILNVNFPEQEPFAGLRLARQGKGYWIENPEERRHPDGHSYYWLGGKWTCHEEHEESDVALLRSGFVTVVPLHFHEMTDHSLLESRKGHFNSLFPQKGQR